MKLIRDKLALTPYPERPRAVMIVPIEVQKRLIFDKVLEEAWEVSAAKAHEQLIEELADLKEVVHRLYKLHEIDRRDVETVRAAKFEKRGGFEQGYIIL